MISNTFLVSIIVPVYNTALYVERCMQSLLSQTYTHVEIIVVNDGSTDNSWEILQQYNSCVNVKLYQKENGGLSDARNFGIEQAKGAYLAFVDSDDWVAENFVEVLVQLAEKYDAEMVICNLQKVDEKGIAFNKLTQIVHLPEKINLNEDFSLFGEISCFACNKLFKKELFLEGTQFPIGIHFEDIATIPVLLLKCTIVAKTDLFLYHYFERRGSISQSFTEKGLDIYKAIDWVNENFIKSKYAVHTTEWKRFVIIQGFYSAGAYMARIKDKALKKCFYEKLKTFMKNENVSKGEIISYVRNGVNYLKNIDFKKKVYYYLILLKI